jgi:glycosyltransferase involved in cell wall biosynthesis
MSKVSILIPLYNAEKYIAQTIESVLNQTFQDWELLILDDCSTDNSYQVAKEYEQKNKRINVRQNAQNLGMMGNWNEGIKHCKHEYFVKLDADDTWHPELLEKSIEILDKIPEVGLVFTKYVNIDENGVIIPNSEITLPDFAQNKAFSCVHLVQKGAHRMLEGEVLQQGFSLMRRKIFDEIGDYLYIQSADTEFYFRVGAHYSIYCIDKIYYYYRVHLQSDSSKIEGEGKRELYLYQAKNEIVKYYYLNKKIDKNTYIKSLKDTEFVYISYLIYQARSTKKYFLAFTLLFKNIYNNPLRFFQFYWQRLIQR